jgi:hypothetical protein
MAPSLVSLVGAKAFYRERGERDLTLGAVRLGRHEGELAFDPLQRLVDAHATSGRIDSGPPQA